MQRKFITFHTLVAVVTIAMASLGIALISKVNAAPQSGERLVTIHDRGVEKGLITKQDTLRGVFEEVGIQLDKNDRVEPGLDEKLVTNNYQVNVYRARPIIIVDNNVQQLVMSAHQTPKQIAKHAGISLRDEDKARLLPSTDIVRDGASLRMEIDRSVPVELTLYGSEETVYTQASTVADFLKEKNIKLGEKDDMSEESSSKIVSGMSLQIWRNGKQTITKKETIPFQTEQIQDSNRESGYKKVTTKGEPGTKMVTYEIVMRDGREVSRKSIQTVVTDKPTKQVEVVGAKFNYTGGPLSDKQINALGQCETGMNPTTNTGNGFYGAFQFMAATWRTVAPAPYKSGLPHQAPLDAQKQAVQSLLSRSSIYTQFPGCAKKMSSQGIL